MLKIHVPFVNMRQAPSDSSKVVSQALYGEPLQIKELSENWHQIMTPDGYLGWVKEGCFVAGENYREDIEVTRLAAHIYSVADTEYGPMMSLPFGSKLEVMEDVDVRWFKIRLLGGKEAFIQKGDVEKEELDLRLFSQKFLGLPYTWGGRSSFGFDCSGFTQMLYARRGIQLPRDAREQISVGKRIPKENLCFADLIFWGKSQDEVQHVGMFMEGDQFIHTSVRENKPYVRMSKLSDFEWRGEDGSYYPFRACVQIG